MKEIDDKINNSGGADGQLTAEEYNDRDHELENAVLKSNQALTPGAGDDNFQLAKAIANVVQYGAFKFTHGGAVDAYTVDIKAEFQATSDIEEKMEIQLVPVATNTGPATLDYNGEGPLLIKGPDGLTLLGGELLLGYKYNLYRKGNEWWMDTSSSSGGGGSSATNVENYLINGDFFVKSFGESFSFSTTSSPFAPVYFADTWQAQLNDDGGLVNSPTQQVDVDISPLPYDSLPAQEGGENYVTFSASILSGGDSRYSKMSGKIEGVNTLSNSSNKATLSFYAKATDLVGPATTDIGVAVKKYHGVTEFNDLNIPDATFVQTAQINATDIAWIDYFHKELRTYRWDGSNWSQIGNSLPVTFPAGGGNASIARVTGDDQIVMVFSCVPADPLSDRRIFSYSWDGTDWSLDASFEIPDALAGQFQNYTVVGYPYDLFDRFGSGGPDSIIVNHDTAIFSLQGTASTGSWVNLDLTPPVALSGLQTNKWDGLSNNNIIIQIGTDLRRYESVSQNNLVDQSGSPIAIPFTTDNGDCLCTMKGGSTPPSPTYSDAKVAYWAQDSQELYLYEFGGAGWSSGTSVLSVPSVGFIRRISDDTIALWDDTNNLLKTFYWNGLQFVESSDAPASTTSYTMQDVVTLTPDWQKFVITGDYEVLQDIKENSHAAVEFFITNGSDNTAINGLPEIDNTSIVSGKIDVANVQIIKGLSAAELAVPNRAAQVEACRRYFQKIYFDANTPFTWRANSTSVGTLETRSLPVPMRTAPSSKFFNNGVEADIDLVNGQALNNAAAANDGILEIQNLVDNDKVKLRINGTGYSSGTFYGHVIDNDSEIWLDAGYYTVDG